MKIKLKTLKSLFKMKKIDQMMSSVKLLSTHLQAFSVNNSPQYHKRHTLALATNLIFNLCIRNLKKKNVLVRSWSKN